MKKIAKLLLSLVLVMTFSLGVMAQETTAEIQGLVSTGKKGLAGATITAIQRKEIKTFQP